MGPASRGDHRPPARYRMAAVQDALCASACLTPLRCVDAVPAGYPSPASIMIASSALIVVITMGADGARPRFRTGAGPPGVLVWTLPPAAALLSARCEVERVSGPLPRSVGRPGQGISGAFAVEYAARSRQRALVPSPVRWCDSTVRTLFCTVPRYSTYFVLYFVLPLSLQYPRCGAIDSAPTATTSPPWTMARHVDATLPRAS
jgi:hypothetical protein